MKLENCVNPNKQNREMQMSQYLPCTESSLKKKSRTWQKAFIACYPKKQQQKFKDMKVEERIFVKKNKDICKENKTGIEGEYYQCIKDICKMT